MIDLNNDGENEYQHYEFSIQYVDEEDDEDNYNDNKQLRRS